MAGQEAVGAVSGAFSDTTRLSNPSAQHVSGDGVSLSEMARGMLSSISSLQTDFQADVVPAAQDSASISKIQESGRTEKTDPEHINESVKILTDQIEHSSQVQQQLTRFVMASSVSSSLGRNLNMFLRGQ